MRLPETLHPEDRRPLTVERTAYAFRLVLSNRIAFGYTAATATIFGVLFGFINQAEQIYTEVYDLGPAFTLYFSGVAIFMAAASFLNSQLVERFGMRRLSHGALVGFCLLSGIHLVLAWSMGGATPFWMFFALIVPTFCLFGFIGTNFNALAMDPLGHVAGTASSVLGFRPDAGRRAYRGSPWLRLQRHADTAVRGVPCLVSVLAGAGLRCGRRPTVRAALFS